MLRGIVVEGLIGYTVLCDGGVLSIDEAAINGGNSPLNGFEAVHLIAGELRVSRCQIRSLPNSAGTPLPAIGTEAGSVFVDPTAQLVSVGGAPLVDGPATVRNGEIATLGVTATTSSVALSLHGLNGAVFVTLLSLPGVAAPSPWGDLWVDPDNHLLLHSGSLATTRGAATTLAVPSMPPGFSAVVQSVLFDGQFALSNGTAVVFP